MLGSSIYSMPMSQSLIVNQPHRTGFFGKRKMKEEVTAEEVQEEEQSSAQK